MNDIEKKLPSVPHTKKNVKVIGKKTFINAETGEIEEMAVTSIEERDYNFAKIWMRNFISTLEMVGNQKTKLAYWIIDNLDSQNRLIATNRAIEHETGISLKTVSVTMKILQEVNFLRKTQNGVYVVNPDIYFKGQHNHRMNVLNQYQEIGYEPPKLSREEKISSLQESIAMLQAELEQIKKEPIELEAEPQTQLSEDGQVTEVWK